MIGLAEETGDAVSAWVEEWGVNHWPKSNRYLHAGGGGSEEGEESGIVRR